MKWLKLVYTWFIRLFARPAQFKEIERKYLLLDRIHVPGMGPNIIDVIPRDKVLRVDNICQFWLPGTLIIERFRRKQRTDAPTGVTFAPEYFRTLKFGKGIERDEIEEACDATLYAKLESAAASFKSGWPMVIKTRWSVLGERPGEVWEIDVNNFGDWHGYALAEIELSHRDVVPTIPDWLAPYVMREVTDDGHYTNHAIGLHGFPP